VHLVADVVTHCAISHHCAIFNGWLVKASNLAGIARIIELESAVANMAIEVAKLRAEVNALLEANPPKGLAKRDPAHVVIYKQRIRVKP
jgi:hypothetical protein